MSKESIRIGGATGYWGEADLAMPQFLKEGDVDYVVFDYLAEITMSIMARARLSDPSLGYATDFVTAVIKPYLEAIAASGIRLISNAGGVNPESCATAIRELIDAAGLDLKVAVVNGDDLMPQLDTLVDWGQKEMFSGDPLPPREAITSANAYLGAFPVAEALRKGADIVLTGRCVDSAVTLGACIHAFDWQPDDLDKLAAGSLVGHLIECGPQVTGGNFTDWESVADSLHEVGYPIAEVASDGGAVITKPGDTGGVVNRGTVGEQLLYEIADPQAYALPDVLCDFSEVKLEQVAENRVSVTGARGRGVPETYKTSVTWADGWRIGAVFFYAGRRAADKARIFADEAVKRSRRKLAALGAPDFDEVTIETVGDEHYWGEHARYVRSREVAIKVACRHSTRAGAQLLFKELSGAALGAPAGLFFFAGTRAKASPVVRLFSTLVAKNLPSISIAMDGETWSWQPPEGLPPIAQEPSHPLPECAEDADRVSVPLEQLAWARSGDKGDKANIGVMARDPAFLPYIARSLSPTYVADRFTHLMTSPAIDSFYLPGIHAINFVMHEALGGGGTASLRNDPQAKCYAQILLDTPIEVPAALIGD